MSESLKIFSKGAKEILQERNHQILNLGYTVTHDQEFNSNGQINQAASLLLLDDGTNIGIPQIFSTAKDIALLGLPTGWNKEIWEKMCNKSYRERLIIAGALIAAEIDRIS